MDKRITEIYCPNCGAPAKFDIIKQQYLCAYCGSKVEIKDAQIQKQGFRKIRSDFLRDSIKKHELFSANCEGCGAEIVFEENEALSSCPFCGRAMVRREYIHSDNMPECVIPFAITLKEAKDFLKKWCKENRIKEEARKLFPLLDELKGYYLPYELLEGPVHMDVGRMDGNRTYNCEGFINDEFINRSKQLDNLLLDGMEPYDLKDLSEFDFGYVAGHRVKIADVNSEELENRARSEAAETYTPSIRKILDTKAVEIESNVGSAIRLPSLLPVYYICKGELMAAVNGQTGKVSVRALKPSHYYFAPWWFKAIVATVTFTLVLFGALRAFGMQTYESLSISGMTGFLFLIITLCLYSDTVHNSFSVESGRKIFTSKGETFKRERGKLVLRDEILKRKVVEPVFFEKLDGVVQPVVLKFVTPSRIFKIVSLSLAVIFLPVILALLINGFDFEKLELGGSAAWFCIFVPVVPIYLLKFGIVELYDNPWIYTIDEKGRRKRYRKKVEFKIDWEIVKNILRSLFVPPISLAVWFGIICFFTMVYLTAFGF
ncbi:MAG: zinc ribbon domain-containing protein [Erysipelotrichaceae bacterium]|nr:zinc ribbon domain-containing protein [Erysipelotrichaceae bacterium]